MKLSKAQYSELENMVINHPTKHKEGFLVSEEKELLEKIGGVNMDKYFSVLRGNTCIMTEDGIVTYHCDILQALVCGLENRDLTYFEWD
jgi:hypothetical protein